MQATLIEPYQILGLYLAHIINTAMYNLSNCMDGHVLFIKLYGRPCIIYQIVWMSMYNLSNCMDVHV